MKRVITGLLSLMLLSMVLWGVVLPVNAAGSAHMSIQSSAGEVFRGDSFTLTVTLSNDQPVSNGGVILSYDSSAFSLLGGSCNVSNAALAEVSAANGGGVFVLQTDAVVSGTIFTINMQVKEDAPFGTYSISGTPSLSISCSLSGTGVSVACKHSYGSSTKVDDSSHESTCSVCGEKKTDAHAWDGGTVTKAASCKETGLKKLTCTGCGATKEETVPVTNEHAYGSWGQTDGGKHSHTCGVCGKTETASHTWNSGTVIKAATCQETGSRKLTCTGCGSTTTDTVPKTAHAYKDAVLVDGGKHKMTCKDCGQETEEAHGYGESWAADENWHFLRCETCGHEKDQAAHVPGPKATETEDQICTVCSYILQVKGEHVHSFGEEWAADETGHWHACGDCNEKSDAALHVFDDNCDADCNTCGERREPAHGPEEEWTQDETGHWYACRDCCERLGFTPHTPGPEATITAAQVCTVCQFEIAPILPHDHIFDAQGTLHQHICACGEAYEAETADCEICADFPWWIVCIVEAVAFGGVIVGLLLVLKKRRK